MTRRGWIGVGAVALLAMPPSSSLDCEGTRWSSRPDAGGESLLACPRPMAFAFPGQGGDASGWLVLRDAAGWIRGVVSLGLVSALDMPASWDARAVSVPLHADLPRPRPLPAPLAFLADRWWRWRAILGLTPADTEFR